jgi:hypothetical protein
MSIEAKALAQESKLEYIETSCKSGDNLEMIFTKLTEKILERSKSVMEEE